MFLRRRKFFHKDSLYVKRNIITFTFSKITTCYNPTLLLNRIPSSVKDKVNPKIK